MNSAPSQPGNSFNAQQSGGTQTNPFTQDLKGEFTSNFGTNTNAVSQIFKEGSFSGNSRMKYYIAGAAILLCGLGAYYFLNDGGGDEVAPADEVAAETEKPADAAKKAAEAKRIADEAKKAEEAAKAAAEQQAAADLAKAKTAYGDKVAAFQLCKVQNNLANRFKTAGTSAPAACVEPPAFVPPVSTQVAAPSALTNTPATAANPATSTNAAGTPAVK